MTKETNSIFKCALMILNDECPPNTNAYLCSIDDDNDDIRCNECWSHYLFAIVNGQDGSLYANR